MAKGSGAAGSSRQLQDLEKRLYRWRLSVVMALLVLATAMITATYWSERSLEPDELLPDVVAATALVAELKSVASANRPEDTDSLNARLEGLMGRLQARLSAGQIQQASALTDTAISQVRAISPASRIRHAQDTAIVTELERQLQALRETIDQGDKPPAMSVDWLRAVAALLWPLIVLSLAALLWMYPRRFHRLLSPFRSIRVAGAELILQDQVEQLHVEEAFRTYRQLTVREFDRWVDAEGIAERLGRVLTAYVIPYLRELNGSDIEFRATIHVPDLLLANTLYQLVDYQPKSRTGGSGRAFTIRFGIIGKTWRLGSSQVQPLVRMTQESLVSDWGMTIEEAAAKAGGDSAFACILLRDENKEKVGLFYMDSPKASAFGSDVGPIEDVVSRGAESERLVKVLSEMRSQLYLEAPRLRVHER